jgi:hypothetical protein
MALESCVLTVYSIRTWADILGADTILDGRVEMKERRPE